MEGSKNKDETLKKVGNFLEKNKHAVHSISFFILGYLIYSLSISILMILYLGICALLLYDVSKKNNWNL